MVSIRKRSSMALMQEDLAVKEHSAPSTGPRRSRRSMAAAQDNGNGLHSGANGDVKEDAMPITQPKRSQRQKNNGNDDYDEAMSRLQEMEDSLRTDVKRQKRAIESSSVMPALQKDGSKLFTDIDAISPGDKLPARKKKKKADAKTKSAEEHNPQDEDDAHQVPHKGNDSFEEEPGEQEEAGDVDAQTLKRDGSRPPPVNSSYLPLPWKGRLGYACLNTYLRLSNPPVFSSRTCRISSILDHRHPLADPSQPEHPTKNRPDKDKPADINLGKKYVENLGLANARDIVKMLHWNEKYGIRFLRLSSEMFPFASHEEYGYKLAPFASEVLAEAGRVAGKYNHRLTTHPGQFTQLGSPRKEVVRNAMRDLDYHDELLTLLRLPEQQNKDAVMILHMGGVFGDKAATLDRFRENYAKLSPSVKARLVLENDDVSWSVHDLLPICEELNIPMVLDFHHHNIIFDPEELREGTRDIMELFPRIKATWDRKGITQKMHYSEQCSEAITPRQRRKHSPRVMTLPPCADTMDLMIEAKDKEQAVFELMRNYRLPGWDSFNNLVPYERDDENRPPPKVPKVVKRKRGDKEKDEDDADQEDDEEQKGGPTVIPDEEVGMGGPNRRVYWPLGMEEWLRPKKRVVAKKKTKDEAAEGNED